MDAEVFGKFIEEQRKSKGLTQKALADKISVEEKLKESRIKTITIISTILLGIILLLLLTTGIGHAGS